MGFQIETERLILRDLEPDDLPTLISHCGEPESQKNILAYQKDEILLSKVLAAGIAWAKVREREYYQLAVVKKENGVLIGDCTISNVRPESFETVIGWHYGHAFRGNGYATEAARGLLHIGFELNEASEIYADCYPDNKASIRIFEKLGMRPHWNQSFVNLIRGWRYGYGEPAVRYSISRYQWS